MIDESLGDEIQITVIATGFDSGRPSPVKRPLGGYNSIEKKTEQPLITPSNGGVFAGIAKNIEELKGDAPKTESAAAHEASVEAPEEPSFEKPFERPFSKPKSGLFNGFTEDDGIDVPVFLRKNGDQ